MINLKQKPLAYAIGAILASSMGSVYAQEQNTTAEEEVERVSVTGSRILREGAEAPSPVTIISGEELLMTGAISIGEALNDLPSLANTYSMANAGRFIGTAGLNMLDLRGMGTARTLVLVDGKRHVSSSAGSASVDTNTIPTAWIERVEIITGGASAVYGADAVTGVVNFVLKKNITGFNFSASTGKGQEGPYDNSKLTFSYGDDFAEGRGNFGVAASYYTQDGMNATDRAQTRNPKHTVNNPDDGDYTDEDGNFINDGVPDTLWLDNTGWYDDSVAGNFYTFDDNGPHWYIFNPDGSVRPQNLGTTYSNWGKCTGDCDILDLQRYNELQPTYKTYNINFKGNYDLTDNVNLYGEAKYSKTEADSIGQPTFYEYGRGFTIHRDNAYIDDSLIAIMDQYADDGYGDSIRMHRFMEDSGRRYELNEREQTRFVVGVNGTAAQDWDYEVYAVYGQTKGTQTNTGNTINDRVRQSVDAIRLESGEIVCRDEAARAEGCVPTSLFGEGSANPEAVAWYNTTSTSTTEIQQTVVSANMTNQDIYELPAGSVGISFGAEYRKEQSDSIPDAFAATGATFLTALQEEHGNFDVNELFVETSIPLLADSAIADNLNLDIAVRFADYSTIGNVTSWKVGLDWTINDELRFRATNSEAIRAPDIGELFGPLQQSFFSVTDPCEAGKPQDPVRIANCAALGIPVDFPALATVASIEGLVGGNPELNPEESVSLTYGFVYQPSFFEGFVFTVDYWDIDIEDAIDAVGAQDILNKCVDSVGGIDNQFCALITRDEDKEIRLIKSIIQNVARQRAQGIDFEFGYDFEALDGKFTTKLIGTKLRTRKEYPFQIEPEQFNEQAGTTGEATWQANVSISYKSDNWTASWRTRYLEEVSRYTIQQLEANPDRSNIMTYGTYFQSDIRGGYKFNNGVTVEVGIDNVFDRDMPLYLTGTGASSASYDNIGRMIYTTVSFQM